jgi:signal transduction histidine kinase/CheY-like chemotaxis protein
LDGSRLGEPGPDGSPYLFGSATLRDGSTIRIGLPAALAAEAQQRTLFSSLLMLVAVALLALGTAWLVGELAILRPVRELVELARRVVSGDATAPSSVSHNQGEIGELTEAFAEAAKELRAREEQIRQAQKLEALGLMAGGIAHDFNNLVTGVIGFSGLVLARLPNEDPLRVFVAQIEAAGQRAANLTRQLLAFSRRQPLQPQVLDLNVVVTDLEGLLRRAIGEHIELATSFEPELGHVEADRGQLEQVLVNLSVNARDAMPEGGRLTIKTANVVLGEEYARQHVGAQVGHHAMLSVTDTGTGMDADTQARIFEPFFTTKEPGKGTGLGLSTVYGIVNQSGGSIWVYSEVGHGTTFRIYLPRVDRPVSVSGPKESQNGLPRGEETILLVEDDRIVRSFTSTVLESLGYTVLVAGGAHDALPVLASRGPSIDLLLTDLVMPGMGGRELAQKISNAYPTIKILYMSGFDPDTQVGQRAVPYGAPFLQKPFSPATLSQKVREALRP